MKSPKIRVAENKARSYGHTCERIAFGGGTRFLTIAKSSPLFKRLDKPKHTPTCATKRKDSSDQCHAAMLQTDGIFVLAKPQRRSQHIGCLVSPCPREYFLRERIHILHSRRWPDGCEGAHRRLLEELHQMCTKTAIVLTPTFCTHWIHARVRLMSNSAGDAVRSLISKSLFGHSGHGGQAGSRATDAHWTLRIGGIKTNVGVFSMAQ